MSFDEVGKMHIIFETDRNTTEIKNERERIIGLNIVGLSEYLNLSKQSLTWRNYHSQTHEKVVVLLR